jgi:two-component system response regulator
MTDLTLCQILLVEDNSNDVELTIRALKKYHLDNIVHRVQDGEEALDFIFATGQYTSRGVMFLPKVVFLDISLPKLDGIEVLKRIKSDERTKIIPVVIATSNDDPGDIHTCYQLGANSFIQKPVEFDHFMKTISDAVLYWVGVNRSPA